MKKLIKNKVEHARQELLKRRTLDYKWYYIIPHWRNMMCWQNTKRRKDTQLHHTYYKNGLFRFNEELDCVSIVKALRKLELLLSITMNEYQESLANFTKCNVLPKEKIGSTTDFWK